MVVLSFNCFLMMLFFFFFNLNSECWDTEVHTIFFLFFFFVREMNLLYLWGRYWLMTCSPGASLLCGGLSWDGASLSRVGRTGGGGGSAGHTPVSGMPVAQRICWNRFLWGEESSIKCWFPASLWSSLGVGGLHPAGGVWGRQGVPGSPGHLRPHPAPSSFLHLPRLACCLACTSWITPSSRLGA